EPPRSSGSVSSGRPPKREDSSSPAVAMMSATSWSLPWSSWESMISLGSRPVLLGLLLVLLLVRLGREIDARLLALLGGDRRRGVGQRVDAAAGLREGDGLADRVHAGEEGDDAVPAEGDAAVRRGAEGEG